MSFRDHKPQAGPSCTFGAVGDIVLAGPSARALEQHGPTAIFEGVQPLLAGADVLFGNLECVLLPPGFPEAEIDPHGLTSRLDPTPGLAAAGFDLLSLANNHILDGGTEGLAHTRRLLAEHGIVAAGAGATQAEARQLRVLERDGLRIGLLAYAEDSNYSLSTTGPGHAYYERKAVLDDIAAARPQVDVLVVSVHADLEFMETPSPARRAAFRAFARAGATLVLGHHPHVAQGAERIGDSLVVYSLGNFVFHAHTSSYLSPHLPATAQSYVLLVEVSPAGVHGFERVPVQIAPPPLQRPLPAASEEAAAIAARLARLDELVADDAAVAANWRAAAVRQLMARLRSTATLERPQDVLHALATMVKVAENRAWIDEIGTALDEIWDEQRTRSDPYHRPGFGSPGLARPRRSRARRAAGRARRFLGAGRARLRRR